MDAGILRAFKAIKDNPYIQYVGLGLAGLVTQASNMDEQTGKPLRKTKCQLVRISAAVCGIELCYAAETAFVSPVLLKLGVPASLMTMVWCLSPVLGFFLVPVMGSLSDRCPLRLGRRRPFIILLSVGVIIGLLLVPNGEDLGIVLGDVPRNRTPEQNFPFDTGDNSTAPTNGTGTTQSSRIPFQIPSDHWRGVIFTILGVALLDFNCDACQSPCRAYLLDISVPEDHSTGLSMFTVMAGAGGAVGYVMGGINWNITGLGEAFGGHIRVVFTMVLVAFILCVISTLTSFREIPLHDLNSTQEQLQKKKKKVGKSKYKKFTNEEDSDSEENETVGIDRNSTRILYGAIDESKQNNFGGSTESRNKYKQTSTGGVKNKNDLHYAGTEPGGKFGEDYQVTSSTHAHLSDSAEHRSKQTEPFQCVSASTNLFKPIQSNEDTSTDTDAHSHTPSLSNVNLKASQRPTFESKTGPFSQATSNGSRLMNGHIGNFKHENGVSSLSQDRIANGKNHVDEISPYSTKVNKLNGTVGIPEDPQPVVVDVDVTLGTYLKSIVHLPRCMLVLCATNLFCWMSLVCYSLFFTDFVGQCVYGGSPVSPPGSKPHLLYDEGVRLGSFGMALYSLSCSAYSLFFEKIVSRFRAKRVYVIGQLVFTVGMAAMAAIRSRWAVLALSPTAGIMYATLFNMPYQLVAHYHTRGLFSHGLDSSGETPRQVRGLGTDVAIVSSMAFLAQFLLSVLMGTIVSALNSSATVIWASAIISFCGAMTATQVTYLDL